MKRTHIVVLGILLLVVALAAGYNYMRTPGEGDTVRLHYTLTLDNGTVYFTSEGREPLEYTLGEGQLLPDLEAAVANMEVRESRMVEIPVERGYGPRESELVATFDRGELPEGVQPEVGQQVQMETASGSPFMVSVIDVTEDTVTVDANHPLAGNNLNFEIQLLGIDYGGPLGRLANLTDSSWGFLALVALVLALALFALFGRGGLRWMRARGRGVLLALRRRLAGRRLSWIDWALISLAALGALLLGYGLLSAIVGEKAQLGDTVSVYYTLRLDDGTIYNATAEGEPLQLTLGDGRLIAGVEDALVGMNVGESKTVTIPPEKAYGPHRPELVMEYDRKELRAGAQPVIGQQVNTTLEDGSPLSMVITEISETTVTLDGNHPLAGKNLNFDVQLAAIGKDAAPAFRLPRSSFTWFATVLGLLALGALFFYVRGHRRARAHP